MKCTRFLAIGVLVIAGAAAGALATESQIRRDGERFQLSTVDGFTLILDACGGAVECRTDGRGVKLKAMPLVRFEEVIETPESPDLLGGISAKDWGMPAEALEDEVDGQAGPWLRVQDGKGFKRTVTLNQTAVEPLVLSGWCQTRLMAPAVGWWNRGLALNAAGVYADGEKFEEVSAYFGQYQHGPQFNKRVICPDRPLKELQLELTALPGECTAWYREVQLRAAQYRITEPNAPLKHIDACLIQEYESAEAGLRSWITYQPMDNCIEIRGVVESTLNKDRAVSIYVSLPFDAVGGKWHDHFRKARAIEKGKVYRDESSQQWYYLAGRDGRSSIYPVACVDTPDGAGLAVATSIDQPQVFQTEYDAAANVLRIRFDVGLSPDAGKNANRAVFTARLFGYDTADGFRGATEKYHQMYAWAFKRRVDCGGTWLAFMSPAFVAGGDAADFHFKFIESVSNMGYDEQQGMYSLLYCLPHILVNEFPGYIKTPELCGPALPETAVGLAKRIPSLEGLPLEMYRRYRAFEGAYSPDKWGQPNGFFWRNADGSPGKNHLFINPDCDLAAPAGTPYSYGGYEREMIREVMGITRQWHVPGWRMGRVLTNNFFEIDADQVAEGKQSLRLELAESKNYFEQYARGLSQDVYLDADKPRPLTVSLKARCDLQEHGKDAEPRCTLTFWDKEGKQTSKSFAISPLTTEWKSFTFNAEAPALTKAVTVKVEFNDPRPKPNVLRIWLDDMALAGEDGKNLVRNGGFEEARLLPCAMDGIYLDVIEGTWGEMNYRREHWRYTDIPLTFDCGRDVTMLQEYTHTVFARQMAEWLHPQGKILFANMVPQVPFMAPYLDVMSEEGFWKVNGKWQPREDARLNFVRFMCRAKPFNILQYGDLTVEEQTKYVKRCLFYGIFPSNQADPAGQWYWANPVMVARHRAVFKEYVPFIIEVAKAGWQPVTLARSDNKDIWLERFGEGDEFYLSVFNPSATEQTATITLDPRAKVTSAAVLEERLSDKRVGWTESDSAAAFTITLKPEDAGVYRIRK